MASNAATLSNLLAQMYQNREVLQGWDAVMNLLESSVNEFFLRQWYGYTGRSELMVITSIWCEDVLPFQNTWFTNVYQFEIKLGQPLFQFMDGQNAVTVRQNIIIGTFNVGTMEVPKDFDPSHCGPIDPYNVTWSSTTRIDASAGAYVSGTVSLTQVTNYIPDANSLILDFAKGAFTINNLSVQGIPPSSIVDQIIDWFATNEIIYVLASVSLRNFTGSPALTPTSFLFNVINTNAGNTIVQLLITTNGSAPSSRIINVNEPIPTADYLTCSLMVSSRILYNDVLIASFNANGGSFILQPVYPSSSSDIWRASIYPQFHFSGSFSFGNCCNKTTVTYSIYLGGIYSGSQTDGFCLTQHVTTTGNVPVTIDVFAKNPVSLSGSGKNQVIKITPGTPSVTVSGSVEEEIKSELEDILNNDLKNSMAGISFSPITCFALETMIFPQNLINMTQVQVPGDLLIVGTFQPNV